MNIVLQPETTVPLLDQKFNQVEVKFEPNQELLWTFFNQQNGVPCFTQHFMKELFHHNLAVEHTKGKIKFENELHNIRYAVVASKTPDGLFNMGGDLESMAKAIRSKDREKLEAYAKISVDVVYHRIVRHNIPSLTTIALLQGVTIGAGIEAALTNDIVIAEKKATFAFPEILFNMFPGMGAYSLISRKAGMRVADKMILEGGTYTAEQCYEMGLVDILVEDGHGESAVYDFIRKQRNRIGAFNSIQKAKQIVNPVTYEELMKIVMVWVDNALNLTERDLKMMDRFIGKQNEKFAVNTQETSLAA